MTGGRLEPTRLLKFSLGCVSSPCCCCLFMGIYTHTKQICQFFLCYSIEFQDYIPLAKVGMYSSMYNANDLVIWAPMNLNVDINDSRSLDLLAVYRTTPRQSCILAYTFEKTKKSVQLEHTRYTSYCMRGTRETTHTQCTKPFDISDHVSIESFRFP